METLGRLGVGGIVMRFPLDQGALCFALMLEIGVTVLVRLMV